MKPIHRDLFKAYLNALDAQEYPHWMSIVVGEDYVDHKNIVSLQYDTPGDTIVHSLFDKLKKLSIAKQWLDAHHPKPDYLIRLDHDDLFSPSSLRILSNLPDFACYHPRRTLCYVVGEKKLFLSPLKFELSNSAVHAYQYGREILELPHALWHRNYYRPMRLTPTWGEFFTHIRTVTQDGLMAQMGYERWRRRFTDEVDRTVVPQFAPALAELDAIQSRP